MSEEIKKGMRWDDLFYPYSNARKNTVLYDVLVAGYSVMVALVPEHGGGPITTRHGVIWTESRQAGLWVVLGGHGKYSFRGKFVCRLYRTRGGDGRMLTRSLDENIPAISRYLLTAVSQALNAYLTTKKLDYATEIMNIDNPVETW